MSRAADIKAGLVDELARKALEEGGDVLGRVLTVSSGANAIGIERPCHARSRALAIIAALPELVRAVTLRQPYAGLVAAGLKLVETRDRKIPIEGWTIVCAGLGVADVFVPMSADQRAVMVAAGELPTRIGVLEALVRFGPPRPLLPEDEPRAFFYAPDRYAWDVLERIPLEPAGVRGWPGPFRIPRELLEPRAEAA